MKFPVPTRIDLHPGSLEALKWLAAICMVIDHVNRHLLHLAHPALFAVGRLAFPLFAFVLAYNLAQATDSRLSIRVLGRLLPVAILSCLPYMELNLAPIGFYPLNVLFTLAAGTAITALLRVPNRWRILLAILLFAGAGKFFDFGWSGIGLFVSCWYLCKRPTALRVVIVLVFLVLLDIEINGNQWALAAIAPVLPMLFWKVETPRWRGLFYYFYPLHLCALVALKILWSDG